MLIFNERKDVSDQSWSFYCDLSGAKKIAGTTIPPQILLTQQRPDLMLIKESSKSIIIVELTVPFEQNIHTAHERQLDKYSGLTSDLQEQCYDTKLLCAEVGSRGFVTDSNARSFQSIFPMISNNEKSLKQVSKNSWNLSFNVQ